MKFKLKELAFEDNLKFNEHQSNFGKILNLEENIEFQTPTVKIINIDDEYITLQILPSEACKIFYSKIHEFEEKLKKQFNKEIENLFIKDLFKVKIKNNSFKIFYEGSQFNLYHLRENMNIICLVNISKLWINLYDVVNYTLNVNEILVKKT
jgi:hypothetical protein